MTHLLCAERKHRCQTVELSLSFWSKHAGGGEWRVYISDDNERSIRAERKQLSLAL
jgi:hypothetical protein